MNRSLVLAALLLLHLEFATQLLAAELRLFVSDTDSFRAIVIEGEIEPGDFEEFIRIVRDNQGKIREVAVFSPGGDFYEAMKIGRAMRALQLASRVPVRSQFGQPLCDETGALNPLNPQNCTCASAGFFIHIGGVERNGTYLAVHRPYFGKGPFGKLPLDKARTVFDALQSEAKDYMHEMGVPEYIQDDILATPSERSLLLDDKTVRTYFWGALPYRHEWKRNRCAKLSSAEIHRAENFADRLLETGNSGETGFTSSEWKDYSFLKKKQDEENACSAEVEHQGRRIAYERYFGISPSDLNGYDFFAWSEAHGYIGKSFGEVMTAEHFVPFRFAETNLLELDATTTSPAVFLSDSRFSPKTVNRISLISPTEPSPEFTHRLVEALLKGWGEQTGGNGTSEWHWEKNGFVASLVRETYSANGSFLNLVIEKRGPLEQEP